MLALLTNPNVSGSTASTSLLQESRGRFAMLISLTEAIEQRQDN